MSDLTKLTLSDALDGMSKGDFSSEDITQAHITACENGSKLNAFILSLIHISSPRDRTRSRMPSSA